MSFSLLSCGEGDEEINNNTNENSGMLDNQTSALSEEKIKSIIDQNTGTQASYISKNYRYLLSCEISSTIENKISNASIKYGLEYGFRVPNSIYVEFDDLINNKSQLAVSIVVPSFEEGVTNETYTRYISYYGTYSALCKKQSSGQSLSSSERDLMRSLIEMFENTETTMKKYFCARTYVSVNNTRYYFSEINIVNNQAVVKKVSCYTDERTTTTYTCEWCDGDGKCASSRCNNGLCNACDGVGYSYRYVAGLGNMKEDCVYCNGGKCDSCHGTMKCSRCNGTGKITKTTGGNATVMGQVETVEEEEEAEAVDGEMIIDGKENGYDYVDLGLPSGVLWATHNVGANSPEEYGEYYAWGEIATKKYYDYSNYKWCTDYSYVKFTKYCTKSSSGKVDNKTVLEPEDDVAHVKWGGNWRMPTHEELNELRNIENCKWTEFNLNGNKGYIITSKFNGRKIFLPAAGSIGFSVHVGIGKFGDYWSASLNTSNNQSYKLWFDSSYLEFNSRYIDNNRCDGLNIRPVCVK